MQPHQTPHATKRFTQRVSTHNPNAKLPNILAKAWTQGYTPATAPTGKQRSYLYKVLQKSITHHSKIGDGYTLRLYCGNIYIFKTKHLSRPIKPEHITTLVLPDWAKEE